MNPYVRSFARGGHPPGGAVRSSLRRCFTFITSTNSVLRSWSATPDKCSCGLSNNNFIHRRKKVTSVTKKKTTYIFERPLEPPLYNNVVQHRTVNRSTIYNTQQQYGFVNDKIIAIPRSTPPRRTAPGGRKNCIIAMVKKQTNDAAVGRWYIIIIIVILICTYIGCSVGSFIRIAACGSS